MTALFQEAAAQPGTLGRPLRGVKHFCHPAVGRLDLTFDAMESPPTPA